MSFQERNVVSAFIVGLGFFVVYTMWIPMELRAGEFAGPDGVAAMAKRTLWIIGGSIVVTIIVTILTEVIYAVATKSGNSDQFVDERDRQIEHTGDRIGGHLASAIFGVAMVAMAMGVSHLWGIVIITYGFFFGAMLSGVIRMIQHRRGY